MKWINSIKGKLTASLLLAIVLGLVFINNIDERQNSRRLRDAITTMYEDRLVVEGYIFDLSEKVHDIQTAIYKSESGEAVPSSIANSIEDIKLINEAYAKTKLTVEEESQFTLFTEAISGLEKSAKRAEYAEVKRQAHESLSLLYTLSDIQLAEANRVKQSSDHILNYGKSSSQFEMAMLVVIAIIIQALVFASKSLRNKEDIGVPLFN